MSQDRPKWFLLLTGEISLAIGFALLSIVSLLHRLHKGTFRTVLLVIYWLLWGANTIAFPPAQTSRVLFEIDYPLMFAGCLYLAFLILWDVISDCLNTRVACYGHRRDWTERGRSLLRPIHPMGDQRRASISCIHRIGLWVRDNRCCFLDIVWTREPFQTIAQATSVKVNPIPLARDD